MEHTIPSDPILVVDDDPTCCQSMAEALERAGYRVESTTDAVAALWRTLSQEYAMVVTDFAMPSIRGTTLVAEVRRKSPHMPALLVSGFPDQRTVAEARVLGIPILRKPFTLDAILGAVRAQLQPETQRSTG